MLRLKSIKITEDLAEADYYPEDSTKPLHIIVDLHSREIRDVERDAEYRFWYPAHARQALLRMADEHDERKETLVMWY